MNKPWKNIQTPINTTNQQNLIAESNEKVTDTSQINNLAVPIKKQSNTIINQNNEIGIKDSNNNSLQTADPMNQNNNLNNSLINNGSNNTYNGYSGYNSTGYGSNYGGYGNSMGVYGGYGNSIGGYGGYGNSFSGYGGYSGYGGGYGSYGSGYGGYSNSMYGNQGIMNRNQEPDFLDKCFFTIERMNFQLFHLCELARMIQQQSASLTFLMEMSYKLYDLIKYVLKEKLFEYIKHFKSKTIEKIIKIREFLSDFLNTNTLKEDSKLKNEIKLLDKFLIFLMISGVITFILQKKYGS